ncbi:hypothetical protein RN001_015392 [Aquatica leii]|uniref:FAM234A/B beta-propeller domain-containing protein n=1 Tax=Aquatica leii TaxID=1421715 RepID=A0AAN7QCK1_9COLE|nr:hypothetical protein RN001_015392 [Aquatica leii]
MATYPGMNLRGEVRESVTLDEDDLSDVEDEVFIRDGKSGYKFEDISVKKPLMAPRRKTGRPDVSTRLKNRPPCKYICKLCCYAFVAISVLVGLIVLVIVLVSLFPLPLDKLKVWIVSKDEDLKLLPCVDYKVTDVWTVTFPKFISESSVQILDVNQDGVDDVIFGFETGDNDNTIPQELYCEMFFGVSPPCNGGVLALNGSNGNTLWKKWLPHSVFSVICTVDINADNMTDCLVTGKGGIFLVLNARNGSTIWDFVDKSEDQKLFMNIYWPNFVPDQDGDNVCDILLSHTSQKGFFRLGHLMLVSGRTGNLLYQASIPANAETYYTPQILERNGNYSILFGSGSPTVPGNLSMVPLRDLLLGNLTPVTLYQDLYKGVLSPSILVDITGDDVLDVVCAMFNSTVVAIDGATFQQIWNYSVPNSQTLSVPTPGYFNEDNVTDFLVKYQTGGDFPTYYYSQTLILNGKTGKPIYTAPIIDNAGSQMGGLTLAMEGFGFDAFLYWIAECKDYEGRQDVFEFIPGSSVHQQSRADMCKLRFNTSITARLYALNHFVQPPGVEIYNSGTLTVCLSSITHLVLENRYPLEYNNTKMPVDIIKAYLDHHPEIQLPETNSAVVDDFDQTQNAAKHVKYKDGSNFRHKDNGQGLIRDFSRDENKRRKNIDQNQKFEPDYDVPDNWQSKISTYPIDDLGSDYNAYLDEQEAYNTKKLVQNSNRDPRSKSVTTVASAAKTLKKNLSEDVKYGIYDYKNVQRAHTRLLHDLNNLPNEILRDTYFKNREHQLRKSRFEQRDVISHEERIKESEDVHRIIEEEKKAAVNLSESLWDLESEKELRDKDNNPWRGKRDVTNTIVGIPKLTSVGALASSLNASTNSIDLILVTYWLSPKQGAQVLLEEDFRCINERLKTALNSKDDIQPVDKESLEELFMKECLEKRGVLLKVHTNLNLSSDSSRKFPYINQASQMSFGQMTVYRLKIECTCSAQKGARCARFLKLRDQSWASYLGKLGDGVFKKRH